MSIHSIKTTLLLIALLGFLSACQQANESSIHDKQFQALKLFPQGKAFSGFQLTSKEGQHWQADDFKGNYSLVFFGFTNCPDICPTTLLDMQKIDKKLTDQGLQKPRFVFVSVDSDRDTPAVMKEYIGFFNPEFVGLSGDAPNILSLASQLGVAYKVADHQPGDLIYDVDHSAALFLIDPNGERIGLFSAPHDINQITADLAQLMEPA